MRVVIVDRTARGGRKMAAEIERAHPRADVLLYDDPQVALAGIAEHRPDVVLVAAGLGDRDGPGFVAQARALGDAGAAKYVGVVDEPSADWSTRFVDAGARLVVPRPLDSVGARLALRHVADGIPG